MNNIYIVESPLQALCALELALSKESESHGIVVCLAGNERKVNNEQIINIIQKRAWDYTILIERNLYSNGITYHLYLRSVIEKLKRDFQGRVNSVYMGEFRSAFMHRIRCVLKPKNSYLLDDGTVTIEIIERYISKGHFYPFDKFKSKNLIKRLLFSIIYYGLDDKKVLESKIRVYSVYHALSYKEILKMSFDNLKKIYTGDKQYEPDLVYFYGSKYSESKILNPDYELSFLKCVADFYNENDRKVVYFAHRDESKAKLERIKSKLGFQVITPDKTAEVYLLESKVLPVEISSACSSLLVNMTVLFPEIMLRSFKMDLDEIPEKYRFGIKVTYDYFDLIGLKVEDTLVGNKKDRI